MELNVRTWVDRFQETHDLKKLPLEEYFTSIRHLEDQLAL